MHKRFFQLLKICLKFSTATLQTSHIRTSRSYRTIVRFSSRHVTVICLHLHCCCICCCFCGRCRCCLFICVVRMRARTLNILHTCLHCTFHVLRSTRSRPHTFRLSTSVPTANWPIVPTLTTYRGSVPPARMSHAINKPQSYSRQPVQ